MRILVVDDHPIVRAGLQRLLEGERGMSVREAASGKEGLAVFREFRPDLVILDLNLPGTGGLEIIKRLLIEDAAARVLVLSMHDDPLYAMRALGEGAAGYVSKNAPPGEILEAIARIAQGQRYVCAELAQELALFGAETPAHPLQRLSRRDLEILRLLGQGSSLQQIADALGISYKTVANNCSQIKAKLGARGTGDLIRIALENGVISEI